jgi:ATP-dependent protease ClpP protease subunit
MDDGKRTEVICTKLSERMALALLREASKQDRSISEFVYLLIRKELFGLQGVPSDGSSQSTGVNKVDHAGRHD